MYFYDLEIADLVLRVESQKTIQFSECFLPFLAETGSPARPDIRIEIHFFEGKAKWKDTSEQIWQEETRFIQRYSLGEGKELYRIEYTDRTDYLRLEVPQEFTEIFCNRGNLLLYLNLERLLLPFNRVILHASAVMQDGKAYIFSAPSGGGKSTHAGLWETHCGAEVLNGDKVILAVDSMRCTAYGGPIAGSSGIYKKKGAPAAAIIFLEKGKMNQALPEKKRKGYLKLYSELIKSVWDEGFNCRLLELAEEIVRITPLVAYTCTAEAEAVEYIKNYLERNMYED